MMPTPSGMFFISVYEAAEQSAMMLEPLWQLLYIFVYLEVILDLNSGRDHGIVLCAAALGIVVLHAAVLHAVTLHISVRLRQRYTAALL